MELEFKLNEAKTRVIDLSKQMTYDFCTDMLEEIKNAANQNNIDSIEDYLFMTRVAEKTNEEVIYRINEATTLSEILLSTVDYDSVGNVLFEQDNEVLSAIFNIKIKAI